MRRQIAWFFVLLLTGVVGAAPKVSTDLTGNLYRFWLAPTMEMSGLETTGESKVLTFTKSIDQGITFGPPQALTTFSSEVQSCDLKIDRNLNFYLAYEISKEVYLTFSLDGRKKFNPPVKITAEAASPSLAIDNFGKVHLLFLSEDKNLKLKRLNYIAGTDLPSLSATLEARVIFETLEEITNPKLSAFPWGIACAWQTQYLDRRETYLCVSLDQGKNFGGVKTIPFREELAGLEYLGDRWRFFSPATKEAGGLEPAFPNLPAPKLISLTSPPSLEVKCLPQTADPAIYRIDISPDSNFPLEKTWSFEHLNSSPTTEVNYRLPIELAEGEYFLRLSAFDGLAASFFSETSKFKIDRTTPVISIISPTGEVSEQQILLLEGKVNEPCRFSINGNIVTPEANGNFKVGVSLLPGVNALRFSATDEAGNSTFLSKKILYSALRPEITLLKPRESDWFKPDSTILFEAKVRDPQDDIEDEAEAEIIISGNALEDKLTYDKEKEELSGFVRLPKDLPDGKLLAKIRLQDSAGNPGEKSFKINIDHLPPVLTLGLGEPAFTNSPTSIPLPFLDAGAGVDRAGTIIKIAGVSCEAVGTGEIRVKSQLSDGTYEAEVTPRDLIGNMGKVTSFKVIVDTAPPKLVILSSHEAQGKLQVEAEAEDAFLSTVKIYNNQKLIESFTPEEKEFTKEILLFSGSNDILVEALDRAGNRSAQNLKIFSASRAAAALVTKYGNAPNPFSPKSDGQMYFTCTLPSAADLKIYIFDLTGTLIWTASGGTAWNGLNQFGEAVGNGVYPYILQASSGEAVEIHRGKIIVLQ